MANLNQSFLDNRAQILGQKVSNNSTSVGSSAFLENRKKVITTVTPKKPAAPTFAQKRVTEIVKAKAPVIKKSVTPIQSVKDTFNGIAKATQNFYTKEKAKQIKEKAKYAEDNIGTRVGKMLQKVPDTTVKVPDKFKVNIGGGGFNNIANYYDEVVEFATGLPGSVAQSYGKSLTMISSAKGRKELKTAIHDLPNTIAQTKDHLAAKDFKSAFETLFKNPATSVAMDVSDFIPFGGIGSLAVKGLIKDSEKQIVKKFVKEVIKEEAKTGIREGVEKIAKEGVTNQAEKLAGRSITEPSLSKSFKEASEGVASRVEPSELTTNTLGVSKSTKKTLLSNRTNFLKTFDMKTPSKDNYTQYYKTVQEAKPEFENTLKSLSEETNSVYISRLKTPDSLAAKKIRKPEKTLGEMNDSLAATIISDNPDHAIEQATKKGIKITTDYRKEPTFLGYKGVHGDLELPNGLITEVQFNTREGLHKKEYAHKIYDKWREYIEYNGSTTLNDVLKRIPQDQYSDFLGDVAKSIDIYDGKIPVPQASIDETERKLSEQILESQYSQIDRTQLSGKQLSMTNEEILAARAKAASRKAMPVDDLDANRISLSEMKERVNKIKSGTNPTVNKSAYSKSYKETPEISKAIDKAAGQVGDPPASTRRVVGKLAEFKTKVIEYVQNESERVRQIVNTKGAQVSDSSDPYLKATLFPGKVAEKVDAGKAEAEALIKDAKKVSYEFKTDLPTIRGDVNDYLYFKHAPERNAALGEGAAGITDAEAAEGLKRITLSPQGGKVIELANRAAKLNEKTLDMLRDGEVITDELYDTLRTKYQNHVPLNRVFDEGDDFSQALSGRGFDVRSTGVKRAKGSEREVSDILQNILVNYEQAAIRSEKNIVDKSTLEFVKTNKDIFGNLFEVQHPRAIGTDFNGNVLMQQTQDPNILQMFDHGKKTWIKINDPHLAIALRGVGREKLGLFMNGVARFTRLYSGLATRFNPEFAFPNKIRDIQETAIYLASQKEVGFSGAAKTVFRDTMQQNTKAVLDYIRGADSEGAKLYKELKEMGGTTGGFGLSTKEQVALNIERMEKLASSKTQRIGDNLIKYVDNWNTIFEDSTRLSVYRQSLAQGLSKERAAFLAKEASINFNRMGTGGPMVNALWMFSNASIQGTTKMLRALKNPKVLGATTLMVGSSVAAVNQWNDNLDPEWRDKVSKWDRLNGLPLVLPNKDGEGVKYISIPVSWGVKPIKVMADYAYDAIAGHGFDPKDFANRIVSTMLEAYNPAGGTDLISALSPTALDIPVEIGRNQSWSGGKIRPDYNADTPDDIKYFQSLRESASGNAAISITELLHDKAGIAISPANIKYAFDGYVGGAGRAVSKTVSTVGAAIGLHPGKLDEFPMVSRFYRERTQEELDQASTKTDSVKQTISDVNRDKFKLKEKVTPVYDRVQRLIKEGRDTDAQEIVDKLSDKEYEAYKSLKTSDKKQDSTKLKEKMYPIVQSVQRKIQGGDNEAAQKIVDELTDEEYKAYISAKKQLGL